jgi:hypothetical protein
MHIEQLDHTVTKPLVKQLLTDLFHEAILTPEPSSFKVNFVPRSRLSPFKNAARYMNDWFGVAALPRVVSDKRQEKADGVE